MAKKGKYKLFSYFIENKLIYYKSLRENDKIIAFSLLEYSNFKLIESILNDFLRKRIIQYYSIQIGTHEKSKKLLLLNFEEENKEKIIKSFYYVQQNLTNNDKTTKFYEEETLENMFLAILFKTFNSNTFITKNSESIKISNGSKSKFLNFFKFNLDFIEEKRSFVSTFFNLITNLGKSGYLIFNFKIDNRENIKISPYFVEETDDINSSLNIEKKVNKFFKCKVLKRHNVKINSIFNYLWRLEIFDDSLFLNDYYDLFYSKNSMEQSNLLEMNEFIEQKLINNQIEYTRLSKNLLFIEKSYLFLILQNLDSDYIYRIAEKYYPKYIIYILILNTLGYNELQKIESIKLVENIKIINPLEVQNFNYEEFKNKNN